MNIKFKFFELLKNKEQVLSNTMKTIFLIGVVSFLISLVVQINYFYQLSNLENKKIYSNELKILPKEIVNNLLFINNGNIEYLIKLEKAKNKFENSIFIFKNGGEISEDFFISAPNKNELKIIQDIIKTWNGNVFLINEVLKGSQSKIEINKTYFKKINQLENEIVENVNTLNFLYSEEASLIQKTKWISLLLLILSISCFYVTGLVIYEKSLSESRYLKVIRKLKTIDILMGKLVEQMVPLDEGDFTNKIYINDKQMALIANKIDNTREIFSNIIKIIKETSNTIQKMSIDTDRNSKGLMLKSDAQYAKVNEAINRLKVISMGMESVCQITFEVENESNQSKEASQEGGVLVQESINKMDEIRNKIQESAKKIKKSSESAQAITEVTELIKLITKQIEVLAFNAAIQTASSGESGREFTVVAQEVQKLAVDSKEATNKILELVKQVQEDIASAVYSMEKTTQEVIEGTKLNDKAGQALKKIEDLSAIVAKKINKISSEIDEKSAKVDDISIEMSKIQGVNEETKNMANIISNQVNELKNISETIDGIILGYKV